MVHVCADLTQRLRNAVRVLNINNIQVGHVPRNVVAKLAPLLDQGKVTVEGTMLEGNSKPSVSRPGRDLTASSEQFQIFSHDVSHQRRILIQLFWMEFSGASRSMV